MYDIKWLILTDILCRTRTVSKLSHIIVQILNGVSISAPSAPQCRTPTAFSLIRQLYRPKQIINVSNYGFYWFYRRYKMAFTQTYNVMFDNNDSWLIYDRPRVAKQLGGWGIELRAPQPNLPRHWNCR